MTYTLADIFPDEAKMRRLYKERVMRLRGKLANTPLSNWLVSDLEPLYKVMSRPAPEERHVSHLERRLEEMKL